MVYYILTDALRYSKNTLGLIGTIRNVFRTACKYRQILMKPLNTQHILTVQCTFSCCVLYDLLNINKTFLNYFFLLWAMGREWRSHTCCIQVYWNAQVTTTLKISSHLQETAKPDLRNYKFLQLGHLLFCC